MPKILQKTVGVVSALMLIVAGLLALASIMPLPGGIRIFSVLTGSMEPTVPVGAMIISRIPTSEKDLQVDQIITFEEPGFDNKFITHRIAEIIPDATGAPVVKTKGDANQSIDPWTLSFGRIRAVYLTHVPGMGHALNFIRTPLGIILFVIIPTAILALVEIRTILNALVDIKLQKTKKADHTAALLVLTLGTLAAASTTSAALFVSNTVTLAANQVTTAAGGDTCVEGGGNGSITNNLDLTITTGNNTTSNNTVVGDVTTGDVNADFRFENRINTTSPQC